MEKGVHTLSFRSFLRKQKLRWEEWRRSPAPVRELLHSLYLKEAWSSLPEQLSFPTLWEERFSEGGLYWLQLDQAGGNVECLRSEGGSVVFRKITERACNGSIASTSLIVHVDDKGRAMR